MATVSSRLPHPPLGHRPAAVSGRFYPASPGALREQVLAWLTASAPSPGSQPPKLIVVPHAGYVYSGAMAARGHALLAPFRERIRRVVLLGPAHRVVLPGLALPTVAAFDTPLGPVPLDREAMARIADLPDVTFDDGAHAREHALEVQLPFLQTALDAFALVPLVVGQAAAGSVAGVLERLWGGEETVIVVSSDLSHFLSDAQARHRDAGTLRRIEALDATLAPDDACGAHPLNGALHVAARHGLRPALLGYCHSGAVTGDATRVVGYAALAFWPPAARRETDADDAQRLGQALLSRARNAIAAPLGLPCREEPPHAALARPGATFVTLHHHGRLRGCIGRLDVGVAPLDVDVRRNARRTAFEDPRFAPLRVDEWDALEIEVSVLETPQRLSVDSEAEALAALRPGRDGVIFRWGRHRSTFLPQVWSQLPVAGDFLAALKRKAGLPADFWADDVELSRYAVRLFREAGAVPR